MKNIDNSLKLKLIFLFRVACCNTPILIIEGENQQRYLFKEPGFTLSFINLHKSTIRRAIFQVQGFSESGSMVCKTFVTAFCRVPSLEIGTFDIMVNSFQVHISKLVVKYLRIVDVELTFENAQRQLVNRSEIISITNFKL